MYSRAKDYKGWQQQKSKTAFSQENSQSDEGWSKLKKRSCNQKVNGQEDHLTEASIGSNKVKGCLQKWFRNTGTIGKGDKERPSRKEKKFNQRESGCKITSKNNFFLRKKVQKKKTCTNISLG
ncbi:hypothetical protein QL285_088105 [Trifolium repens]|nr:hypothetical protein QL285_088105 [Trifolium repens]